MHRINTLHARDATQIKDLGRVVSRRLGSAHKIKKKKKKKKEKS